MKQGGRAEFRGVRDEQGVTLVELMVSIIVLGIVFTGLAASVITFTRSASVSEHRVEATALLNKLHEDFLLVPWDRAGNLADELDQDAFAAFGLSVDPDATPPIYDDVLTGERDIIIVEDPGAVTTDGCTDTTSPRRAPRAIINNCDFRGRSYDIAQVVTWLDRSGDSEVDTKRLTTILQWSWLGRDFEQRFDSERSPTTVEVPTASSPRAVPAVSPSSVQLDESGTVISDVDEFQLGVTFAPLGTVAQTADIFFPVLMPDGTVVEDSVALTGDVATFGPGGYSSFEGEIPLAGRNFPTGVLSFGAEAGTAMGDTLEGTISVTFLGPDDDTDDEEEIEPPAEDVAISSFSGSPTTIRLTDSSFNCALTLTANVRGLTDTDGSVTVSYSDSSGDTRTISMVPVATPVAPTGTDFELVLGTGSTHGFVLPGNNSELQVTFTVVASRSDLQEDLETTSVTLRKNNGNC